MISCDSCGKSGAKARCSRCKVVFFCNKECQKNGWKSHRLSCKVISKKSDKKVIKKGFLEGAGLYNEAEDAVANLTREVEIQLEYKSILKELIRDITSAEHNPEQSVLENGLLKKLLNPEDFRNIIYCRKDVNSIQGPKTFRELITSKLYENTLARAMPKVIEKAQNVLEQVKKKGALSGDIMDIETERVLRPQILQESFAREVIKLVQEISRKLALSAVHKADNIASPHTEAAGWDQLPDSVFSNLLGGKKYTVVDDFMGNDWFEVIRTDLQRFIRSVDFVQTHENGEHRFWVESSDVTDKYPAMEELISNLQALPHEMNRKSDINLTKSTPGSMLLSYLDDGDCYSPRMDSGDGSRDTGAVFSCVYHIPVATHNDNHRGENSLNLYRVEWDKSSAMPSINDIDEEDQIMIPVKADRLVIYKSREFCHERKTVIGERVCSVTFFIRGPVL